MSTAFHLLDMAARYRQMAFDFPWNRAVHIDFARFYLAMSRRYPSPRLP